MFASKPRPVAVSAKVPWTSSHARTQRPHEMHRSWRKARYGWRSSARGRVHLAGPARLADARARAATSASSVCVGRRHRAARRAPARRPRSRRAGPAGPRCAISMPSRTGVVQAGDHGPGVAPSDADEADAAGAERRPGARRSRASGPACPRRGRPRAPSRRPATSTSTPSIADRGLMRAPAPRGSARAGCGSAPACRRRARTGYRPRAPPAASSSRARSTGASAANISCARAQPDPAREALAAALVGAEVQQVAGDVAHVGAVVEGRRSRRGRACSPRPRAARSRTRCRAATAGRIPPSGPPICSALIVRPSRRPPATLLAQLARPASRTAPRRRPGARSAR